MLRATSPGITSQATKTITLRSQSVTRASAIRLRMKRPMAAAGFGRSSVTKPAWLRSKWPIPVGSTPSTFFVAARW